MLSKEFKQAEQAQGQNGRDKTEGGIKLFSGLIFSPLWPTLDSFTKEDLAHGLMNQNRFAGHTLVPYSVGQHCIIMSRWFRKRGRFVEAKWALLHEGSEGLGLGDMPTPIKYLPEMEPYRVLCKSVDQAVFRKFGLLGEPPATVKELDTRMYFAEAKVLQLNPSERILSVDTSDLVIRPYKNRNDAKKYFLKEFDTLFS